MPYPRNRQKTESVHASLGPAEAEVSSRGRESTASSQVWTLPWSHRVWTQCCSGGWGEPAECCQRNPGQATSLPGARRISEPPGAALWARVVSRDRWCWDEREGRCRRRRRGQWPVGAHDAVGVDWPLRFAATPNAQSWLFPAQRQGAIDTGYGQTAFKRRDSARKLTTSSSPSSKVDGSGIPPSITHRLDSYLVRMKFSILLFQLFVSDGL